MRWCGLKFRSDLLPHYTHHVTTRAVVWIEIPTVAYHSPTAPVTTRAVVWIEIPLNPQDRPVWPVTTRAVVWIEIGRLEAFYNDAGESPPVRWCGLK